MKLEVTLWTVLGREWCVHSSVRGGGVAQPQMRSRAGSGSSTAAQFGQVVRERLQRLGDNRGSSPFRLRIALLVTVLLALALTVLGTYGVNKRRTSIDAAQHAATQLI